MTTLFHSFIPSTKKLGALIACCCFCYSIGFGQSFNTQSGYLVTQKNDTLYGVIKDLTDLTEKVTFRLSTQNDFKDYTPLDIKSFSLAGGYLYKAMPIASQTDSSQRLFLLTLVEGRISLYKSNETYYVQKLDSQLVHLVKKDVTVAANYKRIDNRYIGLLTYLMSDCKMVQAKIKRTNYETTSLIKIVTAYNACVNGDVPTVVHKQVTKTKVQKGIRVGTTFSSLDYFVENARYYDYEFQSKRGYTGGIFFNLSYKNKWSVQPELLLTQKGGYAQKAYFTSSEYVNFSLLYLQLPLSVYYTLPTKRIRPFISVGGVFGYALSSDVYAQSLSNKIKRPFVVDKDEYGYRGGGGILFNFASKYNMGVEYVYENSLINKTSYDQKIHHMSHHLTLRMSF